jgi:hypothetical protein
MALRNAFDNLGTEQALRRIANLLTFSRDAADRIQVSVGNSPSVIVYNTNTSTALQANASPAWFGNSTWNAMDARETQRINMRGVADATRKNRWTY